MSYRFHHLHIICKELEKMMDAYMKKFSVNMREIGWVDGFNAEKAEADKKAKRVKKDKKKKGGPDGDDDWADDANHDGEFTWTNEWIEAFRRDVAEAFSGIDPNSLGWLDYDDHHHRHWHWRDH